MPAPLAQSEFTEFLVMYFSDPTSLNPDPMAIGCAAVAKAEHEALRKNKLNASLNTPVQ